jgi:hypothetical protein
MRPELHKGLAFVDVLRAAGKGEQGPAGQRKEAHQLQQRKTAAGLLGDRLGVSGLVAGRVGHREPGAVDHLDGAPAPEAAAGHIGLQVVAQGAHGCDAVGRLAAVHAPDNRRWWPGRSRCGDAAPTRLGLYVPRRGRRSEAKALGPEKSRTSPKGYKSRWRLARPFGCGPSSVSGTIAPKASRNAEIESAFGS